MAAPVGPGCSASGSDGGGVVVIVTLCQYFVVYQVIHQKVEHRVSHFSEAARDGKTRVHDKTLPFPEHVHAPDPTLGIWARRYKRYYGLPSDLRIILKDRYANTEITGDGLGGAPSRSGSRLPCPPYLKIVKGFSELIAQVGGEVVEEDRVASAVYRRGVDPMSRQLQVSLTGYIEGGRFERGVREMPLLDNECSSLPKPSLVYPLVRGGVRHGHEIGASRWSRLSEFRLGSTPSCVAQIRRWPTWQLARGPLGLGVAHEHVGARPAHHRHQPALGTTGR